MKKTVFIKNAAILTVTSLVLRFIGVIFKVWLAKMVGSEGIGLYQIVFSVYVLAATFATSGICTAVTRLVADELALGSRQTVTAPVRVGLKITLVLALFSVITLFLTADFIAARLLGNATAALSVKILSLSLFFMGGCSCLRGYFIARSRALPPAAVQIFEQIIRITVVYFAVKRALPYGLERTCAAVFSGDIAAEIFAFLILFIFYRKDVKCLNHLTGRTIAPHSVSGRIGRIALPITCGRYLNSLLRTAENVLVPKNLAKYKKTGAFALSQFGMIKGMALPILLFPSTLLNSISTLLIPEISRQTALGHRRVVACLCEKIIRITSVLGMFCGGVFFVCGEKIGTLIYHEQTVGSLLKYIAPLTVLMYLDSVCDGLLKGLDQQNFTFRVSVSDSTLRVILVLALIPVTGLNGFIGIMYFSNIFTCVLNVTRLLKKSGTKPDALKCFVFPFLASISITFSLNYGLSFIGGLSDLVYIILMFAVALPLYAFVMFFMGIIDLDDIKDVV